MSEPIPVEVVWDADDLMKLLNAAQARGWQRAVEALRDSDAILMWSWKHRGDHVPVNYAEIDMAVGFLESLSSQPAEETTDGQA